MIQVHKVLNALEIPIISESENEIRAACPLHEQNGGKRGSDGDWYVNVDSGLHQCWSCGYKGSIPTLIRDVQGIPTSSAIRWLNKNSLMSLTLDDLETRKERQLKQAKSIVDDVITEAHLRIFDDVPDRRLEQRNISRKSVDHYGIRWNRKHKSWIIPVRDIYGKLLGYQEKSQKLTMNRPTSMHTSASLFGLDIEYKGPIIVVESPLDVARLHTAGLSQQVATYGASITKKQLAILNRYRTIYIAMDNDAAGIAGRKSIEKYFGASKNLLIWPYKGTKGNGYGKRAKDPGDMSDKEIHRAFSNATTILEKALV